MTLSSRLQIFFKIGILTNFAKKNYPQAWNFIKKRLQHKCFPVNIAKFLRTPLLKNIPVAASEKTTSVFCNG